MQPPQLQPLWSVGGQPSAAASEAVRLICSAENYGLSPEDYGCAALSRSLGLLQSASSANTAAPCAPGVSGSATTEGSTALSPAACFDLQLSTAMTRLLTEVHAGRVDPKQAGFELPAPAPLDVAPLLTRMAQGSDPSGIVASVEPPFVHYRLLKQALVQYRSLAQQPELTVLPPLPRRKLTLGDHYAGAPGLRRRLQVEGCLDRAGSSDALHAFQLDGALVAALKCFQSRHGLLADGELGAHSYQELTVPFAQRVRQIELTLERWRWLPALRQPTILVNIPAFRLFAFRSDLDSELGMLRMDVIVGQEYAHTQTPVFAADMKAVVFRPYWDVPRSIVLREILPALSRQRNYLESQHLELVRGESDSSPVVPATAQNLAALAAGKLRLRQRPGPDNALGLVKFLLPNAHDVYLHDTPAVHLFKRAQRTFSHGCIRVSDPVALALYTLAANADSWDEAKVRAAMQGPATLRVPLARPVHVLIVYGTAVTSEDGVVHFFADIYGQDRRLQALLGLKPVASDPNDQATAASPGPPSPVAHATGIDVDEVGSGIKAHAAATERARQPR
jgi:murein L,D-transpeptidase YcbB/YkuD